ncbi:Plug domain-containing protein [Polyangium fumosum]|uniref:Plug domain-containing protein n=1 Tax=Polyangium fumosum TaxID=889272 RepID=A0A4U1JHA1_9BACT|nr:Plug domain-containing protein [Polyangium fumosum]
MRSHAACMAAVLAACSFSGMAHSDEPQPAEVTVRAAPRKRDPGRATVHADEARRVAGTRDDALRIVESLPGVARGGFFGGGLVLWGAAPGDSRVTVDGVEIPALYHGNGLRGVLPSGLVQAIDLTPGAYGAEYGRALGGLVRVTTRDLPAEGIHGSIGADFLDAAGMVSAAVGDRVRVAAAARASHFDRLVSAVAPPSVLDIVPIPRYHDYQLKASLALREDEEISAVLLGAGDALTRTQPSSDPANTRVESTENSFQRFYLRYTRALPDGANVVIVPFFRAGSGSARCLVRRGAAGAGHAYVAVWAASLVSRADHAQRCCDGRRGRPRVPREPAPPGLAHVASEGRGSLRLWPAARERRQCGRLEYEHCRRRPLSRCGAAARALPRHAGATRRFVSGKGIPQHAARGTNSRHWLVPAPAGAGSAALGERVPRGACDDLRERRPLPPTAVGGGPRAGVRCANPRALPRGARECRRVRALARGLRRRGDRLFRVARRPRGPQPAPHAASRGRAHAGRRGRELRRAGPRAKAAPQWILRLDRLHREPQ